MSKKNLFAGAVFLALLQIFSASETKAQTSNSREFGERFVVLAVRSVLSAEMTYQATVGQGAFGSFSNLQEANMLDAVLAGGKKYGYDFTLSFTHTTATMPSKFHLTATPQSYPKSGRRSFYIDETGEMRGADKEGAPADTTDPLIDNCASFGIFFNERCVLNDLRVFWGAEMTYLTTVGAGNYGTLSQLLTAGLINSRRASGTNHGYTYALVPINASAGTPASFSVTATPTNYGVSGTKSFYTDDTAVVRGGDKQGQPADKNDPPINE
jgi:hypothetical protein